MLDLEPSLVWVTITGELTEVALMGVYLVILGLEDDLDRLDLEPLEPPLDPPPRPLVSDNSTIVTRTTATRSTVAIRILAEVPTTTILIQISPFVALPSQCL